MNGFTRVMLAPPPVPEPTTLLLVLAGVTILAVGKRRSVGRAGDEQQHRLAPARYSLPMSSSAVRRRKSRFCWSVDFGPSVK